MKIENITEINSNSVTTWTTQTMWSLVRATDNSYIFETECRAVSLTNPLVVNLDYHHESL